MDDKQDKFEFGKNWNQFIERQFSKERVEVSRKNLLSSLKLESLEGMQFLDIGCGSGLHSLAAVLSGAERVVSFDYDPDSVKTAQFLKDRYAPDAKWEIMQGSVLDVEFIRSLWKFDIVYSWGVLHHTGNMWQAIDNSILPLDENGIHFIALYSYTVYKNAILGGHPSPEKWLEVKKRYNDSSAMVKRFMEYRYVWDSFFKNSLFKPVRLVNNYKRFRTYKQDYMKSRGMEFWTDVRDWLGGWPMEFVNEHELVKVLRDKHDLRVVEMYCGEGNTEFISIKMNATNNWSVRDSKCSSLGLVKPFARFGEFGWSVLMPKISQWANDPARPRFSPVRLYENNAMLTLSHCSIDAIGALGSGRYNHYEDKIYFSTSDNTDPNVNDREYMIRWYSDKNN